MAQGKRNRLSTEQRIDMWREQPLARFHLLIRDQGTETIVYRLFQVLFAAKVAFRCQHRGVTEKKLDLLKLSAV